MRGIYIILIAVVVFCLLALWLGRGSNLRSRIILAMQSMGGAGTMADVRRAVMIQRLGEVDPFEVTRELGRMADEDLIEMRWPAGHDDPRKPPALIYELK